MVTVQTRLSKKTTNDPEFNRRGNIIVYPDTMKTSKQGVFEGRDIVYGRATVIFAMEAGRTASCTIEDLLKIGILQIFSTIQHDYRKSPAHTGLFCLQSTI